MNDANKNKRTLDDGNHEEEVSPDVWKRRRLLGESHDNHDDHARHHTRSRHRDADRLSHDDYTVGWVCALHIEMAAARAMLDSVHDGLDPSPTDSNTYTLGNIGAHNIVIACLPSGQYGTNNAATVANNLSRTFPFVRTRLMVGIGGGVPGKADVRLGDVVVSSRVVQYDLGKTVRDGRFQRTATPYSPPLALLTAVSALRAVHESRPSKIPMILSDMLQQNPSMTEYTRHSRLHDDLFDSTYEHNESLGSCINCDRFKVLQRPRRDNTDPKIHYGVVASGNQVIKHGETRDRLAQELDVICFEMEAAGLMDGFPCLVIRGICDYADSHKKKEWQQYAAATAAAFAKELLSFIPATRKANSPTLSDTAQATLQGTRRAILDSLRFEQIDSRHATIKAAHYKTCEWLLEHPDFIDWLDCAKFNHHHGFLWLSGKPGAGKSTLMKFAYNRATRDNTDSSATASFFFNARGDDLEKSTVGMHRSLLIQLLEKLPDLQDVLDDPHLVARHHSGRLTWDIEALRRIFCNAVAKLGSRRMTCFIDALDECEEEQVRDMVEFFEYLGEDALQNGIKLYVCFSSRHYPCIRIQFGRQLVLEDQTGHEKDLEKYVRSRLGPKKGKSIEEVRSQILEKAAGVFMWTVLVVDILNKEYERGRIFAVKKRLQEIPAELSQLFKDILRRDNENMDDLLLCIQWILFAKRPLKREEFYFAMVSRLSAEPEDLAEWDPEGITTEDMQRFVLSSSKGLAETTRSRNPTVQFIHESVRDFLIKDNGLHDLWSEMGDFRSRSHDRLKQCCLAYMQIDISQHLTQGESLPKASSDAGKGLRQLVSKKFPFLEYATRHILYHADAAAATMKQKDFLKSFPLDVWINLNNLFEQFQVRRYTPTASLLYLSAESNWARLIRTLLQYNPAIDILGERHRYPFFVALANDHRDAVEEILQQKIDLLQWDHIHAQYESTCNPTTHKSHTPLLWAAKEGQEYIVKLLIETGKVDVDARDMYSRTPLSHAAEAGYEGVVRLLLDTGKVDVDDRDNIKRTPLSYSAEAGCEGVIKLLLETGKVEVDFRDIFSRTPLLYAAKAGCEGVIKLLLETGKVEVDSRDRYGRTPLLYAAEAGCEGVVRLLLETGKVEVNSRDKFGRTPLSWAASKGHEGVFKLLHDTGKVEGDSRDEFGRTPLNWAASERHEGVVKLLLDTVKVEVNIRDNLV